MAEANPEDGWPELGHEGGRKVLILGGTGEARRLAERLAGRPALRVITSLAGRTGTPCHPPGEVRVGGFGGAAGLAAYLRDAAIDLVVDATHPHAVTISANAARACECTGVPLRRLTRAVWTPGPGDRWIMARDYADAARKIPEASRRPFLTVGRQNLAPFAARPDLTYVIRVIDPPAAPLVEVVVAEQTTEPTREAAVSFVDGLGAESIVVRDTPGFAATRLGLALAVEAMTMVDERVAGVAAIDRATTVGHDHPVGPLAAADERGLDATLDALEHLQGAPGDRFAPPPVLREKVAAGELGRKTSEGFYVWEGGDPVEPSDPDPTPDLRAESPVVPEDQPGPGDADGGSGGEGPDSDVPGDDPDDHGGPVGPGDG
jgi:precorrin-6x reductase